MGGDLGPPPRRDKRPPRRYRRLKRMLGPRALRERTMSGRDFDGFTVVVTGASTGLGRAMAVETARRGAGLVVVNFASSAQEAEETAQLVAAEGSKAVLVQGDVAQAADCRRIAQAAAGT